MSGDDLDILSPHGRFLHHCARGELAYQRTAGGKALFPPRILDPDDLARAPGWALSEGRGAVHSVTLVHHRDEAPFALGLVDLDEGFRMLARIDADDPDAIMIGARVRVSFRSLGEGQAPLPVFFPEVLS